MNISTMHGAVALGLQRVASHAYQDFDPVEIDFFINDATNKYVKAQADVLRGTDPLLKVRAQDSVASLMKGTNLINFTTEIEGVRKVTTPEDLGFALYGRVQLGGTTTYVEAVVTDIETLFNHAPTKTDTPIFRVIPIAIRGQDLLFVPSSTHGNPSALYLTYLKEPVPVYLDTVSENGVNSVSSDLPSHVHQEIVDLTVQLIVQSLKMSTAPK